MVNIVVDKPTAIKAVCLLFNVDYTELGSTYKSGPEIAVVNGTNIEFDFEKD